jgi:hypothetical protein
MSDHFATHSTREPEPTIADIVARIEPMGDLRRFIIEDMSAEEEDEFFSILDDA